MRSNAMAVLSVEMTLDTLMPTQTPSLKKIIGPGWQTQSVAGRPKALQSSGANVVTSAIALPSRRST